MGKVELPEIVIGLLQVKAEPWKSIYEQGQLPTWIKNCPKNIKIINIYGRTPNYFVRRFDLIHNGLKWSPILQGPINILDRNLNNYLKNISDRKWKIQSSNNIYNLQVNTFSTHLTLPIVEKALFKYFLEFTNADFLYMSNTSSYININSLVNLIQDFPLEKVYGGTLNNFAEIDYFSGANRIFSRDLVKILLTKFNFWDFALVEDVSIGKLLINENVNRINIPSMIFSKIKEIDEVTLDKLKSISHFRLKSGNLKSRNDIELMNYLHKKLTAN